jgi:subtilisin family serine protease
MMRFSKRILISFVLFIWPCLALAGRLTPDLQERMGRAGPDERIRVIVRLVREADLSAFSKSDREGMVRHLRVFAAESQRGILAELPGYGDNVAQVRSFWIYNGIAMEATKEVILALLKRPDVGYIEEDRVVKLDPLLSGGSASGFNGLEWNIQKIKADSVWSVLGKTGQGIVVGNIDSGVLINHETFGGRYRGGRNSWFDAVNGQADPYDDVGHGTYTMGTTCGGSTADTIGVARGAKFVCAKAFNRYGTSYYFWLDACYQWFAGLGLAAPVVVGNSWGDGGMDTHFWQESRTLQALGIHQVYSNGNSGPGSGSVLAPASYPHHIGVGATDSADRIASWSSRGPSPGFGTMESVANYLDPDWAASRRKPDLSAPGVAVRSSYRDGGYVTAQGTSISLPHATGTIALMLQKNDLLADTTIWRILTQSCDTPPGGGPYPNQNYGWGRLNAYRAVQMTPPGYPHFRLSALPAETLIQNASVVDSLTVASMGGFDSPVTLTLDSIRPAEPTISVSFNPNPVTPPPNGSVEAGVRIATQPGTPPGDYVVFYHGTGDSVIRCSSVDLSVLGPIFDLQYARACSTGQGFTAIDTVTVVSRFGFNSPVTMTLDSIRPAEPTISVSFDPNPVTPPPNGSIKTVMRITTQTGTPLGDYVVYFHGAGGLVVRGSRIDLNVDGPTFDLRCAQVCSLGFGESVVESVTVISLYNFSSPVTITLDSIRPAEATISVSFDPNPVTPPPNGSVQIGMRIVTESRTPSRNYRVYFRGTAGGITKQMKVDLYVLHTFHMSQTAYSVTMAPNASMVDSVHLFSSRGFSFTVTMALDSIRPAEPTISVSFDPNPVTTQPYVSVGTGMRITTQPLTPLRDYEVYYQGTGGWITRLASLKLKVVAQPFEVSCAPRRQEVHRWCDSVDYNLSLTSLVSYPSACTLSATVDPPGSPIAVSFLPDGIIAKSGTRKVRVQPGEELTPGTYVIKAQARSGSASFTLEDTLVYAVTYFLEPARPNPSQGSVEIAYGLPVESPVSLKIYDLSGRRIRTLVSGREKAGYREVAWDGRADGGGRVPSGVYLYRLTAGSFSAVRKLVILS